VSVVADSGPLYALVDASDAWHERIVAWWKRNRAPVLVPASVIPEVSYLLQTRIGPAAEMAFVRALATGEFTVDVLEADDLDRAADLMEQYQDLPLGFVDASVVAAAERLDARTVLTTDRRHFAVIRPRHARALTLVP
jgi:hypothetical protein